MDNVGQYIMALKQHTQVLISTSNLQDQCLHVPDNIRRIADRDLMCIRCGLTVNPHSFRGCTDADAVIYKYWASRRWENF